MTETTLQLIIIALAAGTTTRLLADDLILEAPREWFLARIVESRLGSQVAILLGCMRCLSFWVALAWLGAWLRWDEGTTHIAVPFALWALAWIVATWRSE